MVNQQIIVIKIRKNNMKSQFKKTFFAIMMMVLVFSGYSQNISKIQISVGGLILGQKYTVEQVTSIFGSPQSYSHEIDVYDTNKFMYNNNTFYINDGKFNCFELVNTDYKLNGVVGVGDTFDKINLLNPYKINSGTTINGIKFYYVYITDYFDDMSPIYFYMQNGTISKINYLYMDDI